jgi:hypothetical protein
MTRDKIQRAIDLLLVLNAAKIVGERKDPPGAVVFHKILFQAKLDAAARGFRAPHHRYIRWKHGPYSRDETDDERLLRSLRLLQAHRATPRGREIVEHYVPLFTEACAAVIKAVERSARKRARWNAKRAMAECYSIKTERLGVDPKLGRTLKDLPEGTEFRLEPAKAVELVIDENVVDDFLLDLRLTEEDRRDGRSIEFAGSVEDLKRELGA